MGMTIALPISESRFSFLRPIHRGPQVNQWKDVLDYLQHEVNFYSRLLGIGIHNAPSSSKPAIAALLHEFTRFQKVVLPKMCDEMSKLDNTPDEETAVFAAFEKQLNATSTHLRQLNRNVFPLLPKMQRIIIL